jgi:multiple sugar transport system permease protein
VLASKVVPAAKNQRESARRASVRLADAGNYLFVLPAVLFLAAFLIYPILYNIRLSFIDVKATDLLGGSVPWVGLKNYREILQDPLTHLAALNTLIFTLASLVFQIVISMGLAMLYNQDFPGSRLMRSLYIAGWAVPVLVSGTMFRWLFDGDSGLVNYVLKVIGVCPDPLFWTADQNLALISTIIANIWLGIPFNLALIYAALQTIPHELYEAASIDGARAWSKFWRITLPLIKPALLSTLILGMIYTVKQFELIWTITQGGPLNSSQVVSTAAYTYVFSQFEFGHGAALLNLTALFLFGATLLYLRSIRREGAM